MSAPVSIEQLEAAIATLDSQRVLLGDATVDAAVGPIREKLAALRAQSSDSQQLKTVSVLFIDIVGSTAMSSELDPEEVHGVVNTALERFSVRVVERNGRVLQYAGDSLLAAFGADEAREDDAENAVHAALAILDDAQRVSREVAVQHGVAGFAVRAGINTGPVLLGGGVDNEGSIRGVTVNVAARMEQTAPVGSLRISHDTYRHVRGVFDVIEEAPVLVKGVDEPMKSYLVLRAKARAFRPGGRRGVDGIDARMVGRDLELKKLTDCFEDVLADSLLTMISIVGDAGLGKSRLMTEFANWLELRPERVWRFESQARTHGEKVPYGLIRDLFCWRFEIEDSDPLPAARHKLVDAFRPAFGDGAEEQAALLGQLIGFDFGDSPFIHGILADPKQIRDRAFNAATRFFAHVAHTGPVLMQFEDLHWADEGSLDFINHLVRVGREFPVLILCSTRATLFERRPLWGSGQSQHLRIDLAALTRRCSRDLADALLGRIDNPPAVLRELVTTVAEGNPFYMEELTKMLIDDGVIVTGSDRWTVVADRLARANVPQTLVGVLQARIDALAPTEKAQLLCAAVVGHVFWDRAVAALEPDAKDELVALTGRELVQARETSAFDGVREFVFKHQVLHQVAYDSVLKRNKRVWHRRAAEWLIEQSGERVGDQYALIADHYEKAGDVADAVRYLRLAAEAAMRAYASETLLAHIVRALTLVAADDLATRFDLLALRCEALFRTGKSDAYLAAAGEMADLAERLDDHARRARAAGALARHAHSRADFREAARIAERGVAWGSAASDSDAGLLAHTIWASALRALGDYKEGLIQAEHVLQTAQSLGNRAACLRIMLGLGGLFIDQRRFAEGREYYEACLPLSRDLGNRTSEANTFASLGDIERCLGNYSRAIELATSALGLYREVGFKVFETLTQLNIATAMRLDGNLDGAKRVSEEGLEMARATGNPDAIAAALLVAGDVSAARAALPEATWYYQESHDTYRRIGRDMMMIEARAGLARVARTEGRHADALAHVDEIVGHFDRGVSVDGSEDPLQIYLTCFAVLEDAGSQRADAILATGHVLLEQALATLQPAERVGVLERVPSHRDLLAAYRRRTGAAAALTAVATG